MMRQKARHSEERLEVRPLRRVDLPAIVEIDAIHSGAAKPEFWAATVERALRPGATAGFVVAIRGEVAGYVFAEARVWEFGSPLCGWITAIGVRPELSRQGVALALGREVCGWLRARGIHSLRTMVRRDAVEVLAFFRAAGFHAGPYLEMELEV
jgi:ribosomal protein S18 acetylase RimI-like enzyme